MKYSIAIFGAIVALVVMSSVSPAFGRDLKTEEVRSADVAGTFTLILYGGRYFKDVETVAFLDLDGDQYTFEPYAPDFDFKVIKGLSAKEALSMAERFIGAHYAFWRSQLSRILDDNGRTVGYEMRPLYEPLTFGNVDVMDINYAIRGDKIRIYIRLKPEVERGLFGGGGSRDSDR